MAIYCKSTYIYFVYLIEIKIYVVFCSWRIFTLLPIKDKRLLWNIMDRRLTSNNNILFVAVSGEERIVEPFIWTIFAVIFFDLPLRNLVYLHRFVFSLHNKYCLNTEMNFCKIKMIVYQALLDDIIPVKCGMQACIF